MTERVCRGCGAPAPQVVLSLGSTPLANALLTADQLGAPEFTSPLDVAFCEACALVQLTETVSPERLFREYTYFSSFADTMVQSADRLATRLVAARRLNDRSLVVEIGSNDGYLLQHYAQAGVRVLGVEPALNVARVAQARGIETVAEFFGLELAQVLRAQHGAADVLHAHNVLAHVPDLEGVVRGMHALLADDGVAVIEVPYVRDLVEHCEFDTIYHEHLCYFSLTSLHRLFSRYALEIQDVERIPLHGGSLRIFAARADATQNAASPRVTELLEEERRAGVDSIDFYTSFGRRVDAASASLRAALKALKQQGATIAAYGAAAKACTLLNTAEIGRDILDFVVDRSPHKQGRYVPGVQLPIRPPEALLETMPQYVLLLAWNLADEIMAQQAEYRARGGRFVLPLPEVVVL
jgi:SAM-dependent methyltransferase